MAVISLLWLKNLSITNSRRCLIFSKPLTIYQGRLAPEVLATHWCSRDFEPLLAYRGYACFWFLIKMFPNRLPDQLRTGITWCILKLQVSTKNHYTKCVASWLKTVELSQIAWNKYRTVFLLSRKWTTWTHTGIVDDCLEQIVINEDQSSLNESRQLSNWPAMVESNARYSCWNPRMFTVCTNPQVIGGSALQPIEWWLATKVREYLTLRYHSLFRVISCA